METILLVEDENELARVVARELEAAGYRTLQKARTTDNGGKEAEDYAAGRFRRSQGCPLQRLAEGGDDDR